MQRPADERTPMVRPSKLKMAPHAVAGYKTAFGLACFILTLFFSMSILVSLLNWDTVCEKPLAYSLLAYGAIGLLFVIVIVRHFCFYRELGSWPSKRTTTICSVLLLVSSCILNLGYISAISRLHLGFISATPRLYLGLGADAGLRLRVDLRARHLCGDRLDARPERCAVPGHDVNK